MDDTAHLYVRGCRHIFVSEKCTNANICQRFVEECLRLIFGACVKKAEFNRSRFRKAGKMACDFLCHAFIVRNYRLEFAHVYGAFRIIYFYICGVC